MNLQSIFTTVLNMSLTGSVVIGFVLLFRFVLGKAPKAFSYALWAVVLFRLLCPVSFSSALSLLHFTGAEVAKEDNVVTSLEYGPILDIYIYAAPGSEPETPPAAVPEPEVSYQPIQIPENTSIPDNRDDFTPTPDAVSQQATAEPVREPFYYAVIIWLVGMGVMLLYNIYSYRKLRRKIVGAVRLRKNIYLADHICTPFVIGVFRPRIYLPSVLDVSERKYIIAHERYHIRRKDHIIKLFAYGALCIHWFNPLVWVAFALSGKDMEMSCDEAVIEKLGPKIRADYSASLLRLATGHRIIAGTPLAFGEGDTKGRVLNMAKWKRPRFWVVLCAAIVCIGVLVACAVNPVEKQQQPQVNAPSPTAPTTPEAIPLGITDIDPMEACNQAMDELMHGTSYYIHYDYSSDSFEDAGTTEYRRHGSDLLIDSTDNRFFVGNIYFDGVFGMYYGDYWAWEKEKPEYDPNEWLTRWSTDEKQISNLRWTENGTVVFDAVWPHQLHESMQYKGTFTYSFHKDGSLASIEREYVLLQNGEATSATRDKITVREEKPEDTYTAIKKVADLCVTLDELEAKRNNRDSVTEVPSNSTRFDQEFELGSAQMRWKFLDGTWQFAFGADNVTPTSATLFHAESSENHKSLVAEDGFWLETLVDGKWKYVNETKKKVDSEKVDISVSGSKAHRYQIDWSDSYGKLSPGFYRIGRYYTVTLDNGKSQTNVCYAKFRIMDDAMDKLLTKCENAFNSLLTGDRYHVFVTAWLTQHEYTYYITEEVWKSGADYLSDTKYPLRTDPDTLENRRGGMLRGSKSYDLEWSGNSVISPIASWQSNTYMDEGTFQIWTARLEWYDARVETVIQKGNKISIIETYDFDDKYEATEITLTFDEDGNLTAMTSAYLPTRDCAEKDKVIDAEMVVQNTSPEEIANIIAGQDLSKPMSFSYAQDVADHSDAQTSGFVNTKQQTVRTMEDALRLADKECTLIPQDSLFGKKYNMTAVYYDAAAQMWKVEFMYSANSDIYQAVYLDANGITKMIVTK